MGCCSGKEQVQPKKKPQKKPVNNTKPAPETDNDENNNEQEPNNQQTRGKGSKVAPSQQSKPNVQQTRSDNNKGVQRERGGAVDDEALPFEKGEDCDQVPMAERGYPPPATMRSVKVKFDQNDLEVLQTRAKTASPSLNKNYDELASYLTKDIKSEYLKARALLEWMNAQDYKPPPPPAAQGPPQGQGANKGVQRKQPPGKPGATKQGAAKPGAAKPGAAGQQSEQEQRPPTPPDPNTPEAYMKLIGTNKGSYSSLYALLCRHAGLMCIIVDGIEKDERYEVGSLDISKFRGSWNMVFADGGYKLVHPFWACETGPELNDYWFFIEPFEFAHFCFPEDKRLQLLSSPISFKEFKSAPFVKPPFFQHGFSMYGPHSGVMECHNGIAEIKIKSTSNRSELMYDMDLDTRFPGDPLPYDTKMEDYCIVGRDKGRHNFYLRFPSKGVYKMSVIGGPNADDKYSLCDFRINVSSPKARCTPIPRQSPIGFGPGNEMKRAGLLAKSHTKGILRVKKGEEIELRFHAEKNVSMLTEVESNAVGEEELKKIVIKREQPKEIILNVCVPEDGDYLLFLHTKANRGSPREYVNVCNYFITTDDPRKKPMGENATTKSVREDLKKKAKTDDMEGLADAVERFERMELDDRGEYTKGKEKLEYLRIKEDLRSAINRRREDILTRAIDQYDDSDHVQRLSPEYTQKLDHLYNQAKELRDRMRGEQNRHEVRHVNRETISEVHTYNNPPRCVSDTMKAFFILLGEKEYNLDDWGYVMSLVKYTGRHNLERRIQRTTMENVPEEKCDRSRELLDMYDIDQLRSASTEAASFYKTAREFLEKAESGRRQSRDNRDQNDDDDNQGYDGEYERPNSEGAIDSEDDNHREGDDDQQHMQAQGTRPNQHANTTGVQQKGDRNQQPGQSGKTSGAQNKQPAAVKNQQQDNQYQQQGQSGHKQGTQNTQPTPVKNQQQNTQRPISAGQQTNQQKKEQSHDNLNKDNKQKQNNSNKNNMMGSKNAYDPFAKKKL